MPNIAKRSDTGETFEIADGESILEAATRAGVPLPHECTFGGCGTCRIKVQEGAVQYDEFPMALTEEEHEQGFALACQARPLGNLVIEPAAKGLDFVDPVQVAATVVAVEAFTQDIAHLTLRLPPDLSLDYRAGQYMNLLLPEGGTRSFSMACPPSPDNVVDFHIRRIPGGHFTGQVLGSLRPGDELTIDIPLGTFCHHPDDWRPMILAATGTGLAPIKAILESLLDNDDCPPVALYWGMRTEAELYLKDEIESWRGHLCEFEFVPVLSRAGEEWQGRRGYVQDAVAQDYQDLSEHAFYLCGAPDMIRQARKLFVAQGADPSFIYSDSFTFQQTAVAAA